MKKGKQQQKSEIMKLQANYKRAKQGKSKLQKSKIKNASK